MSEEKVLVAPGDIKTWCRSLMDYAIRINQSDSDFKVSFEYDEQGDVTVRIYDDGAQVYDETIRVKYDDVDLDFNKMEWAMRNVLETKTFRFATDEDIFI